MTLSVPLAGYNSIPLSLPALDFSGAQAVAVSSAPTAVQLAAGVYYLVADVDFEFDHGADASGVLAPGYAGAWLAVFLDRASELRLKAAAAGTVKILPTRRS